MATLIHWVLGIACCLGSFGFIIFIHELGHYIAAVRSGVYCPNFAIGFGPVLLGFRRWGTFFSLRLFPIGGYVHMVGEDPNADQSGWYTTLHTVLDHVSFPTTPAKVLAELGNDPEYLEVREHLSNLPPNEVCHRFEDLDGNFNHRSVRRRLIIILGGVTMNFIAATLLMWILGFTVGIGEVSRVSTSRVGEVREKGAGAAAGLKSGDEVIFLGNTPIVSGGELMQTVGEAAARPSTLGYRRGDKKLQSQVTPDVLIKNMFVQGRGEQARVLAYEEDGPTVGLAAGDVIIGVNDRSVTSPQSLVAAINEELGNGNSADKLTLTLKVKDKPPFKLEGTRHQLKPQGKLGVILVQVNSISFVSGFSSEVTSVKPGSPAANADLRPSDIIYSVNDFPVLGGDDLTSVLKRLQEGRFEGARLTVIRDEELVDLDLKERPGPSAEALGVALQPIDTRTILTSPFGRIWRCLKMPVDIVSGLLTQRFTANFVKKQSQGPVGMMQMLFELSDNGWADVLWFVSFLNAAVGAFNLIPFPALDGMRAVILMVGGLRGRNVNPEKEALFHLAGLGMLLCVVIAITYQDIGRLWAGTPIMK